jgi:hypothetical protein
MAMLGRTLRAFATTVELNATIPPKLRLNLRHADHEFTLDPEKRVKDLVAEISSELRGASVVEVKTAGNDLVDLEKPLGHLIKQCFWIHVDKKAWRVYPNVRHIIGGNLSLLKTCEELGVPMAEAQKVSQFYGALLDHLPEQFSKQELQLATKQAFAEAQEVKSEDIILTRHLINEFKHELEPLQAQVQQCRSLSQQYAQRVLRLGQLALIAQWGVLGYGTFVTYGWDVMEPVSYMVGITWATLGFSFFVVNKSDFEITSFREMLQNSRYAKLLRKYDVDQTRIEVLSKNILALEERLADMEAQVPFKTFA